jgi:hypothetical protein
MAEFSWPWPDTDPQVGDGRKITAEEYATRLLDAMDDGVLVAGDLLAASSGEANRLFVETGAAYCRGRFYENSTQLELNPDSAPAGHTRDDRVILECDWAGGGVTEQYTVRIVTKAGAEGAPPALTQTPGVLWQDALWTYTIDDAGVMTDFVDERNMLGLPSPQYSRQGGDADDFSVWGTTHYLTGQLRVQFGVMRLSGGAAVFTPVTFPVAFSEPPVVFLQSQALTYDVATSGITAADFDIDHAAVGSATIYVHWLAIGPK